MRAFTISSKDIAACPKHSMSPRHYRTDGSCRCVIKGKVTDAVTGAGWALSVTGSPKFVDKTIAKTVPVLQKLAASVKAVGGHVGWLVKEGQQKGQKDGR